MSYRHLTVHRRQTLGDPISAIISAGDAALRLATSVVNAQTSKKAGEAMQAAATSQAEGAVASSYLAAMRAAVEGQSAATEAQIEAQAKAARQQQAIQVGIAILGVGIVAYAVLGAR